MHERQYRTENPNRYGFWYVVRIFGTRFNGTVRGTDFRYGFFRYGTWYGFWSGLEPGTVRGTDFGTKKSVPERIFFRYGRWYGPNLGDLMGVLFLVSIPGDDYQF